MSWDDLMAAARRGEGPLRHARRAFKALLDIRMPVFRPLASLLYSERRMRAMLWPVFLKIIYREPLMRYRCAEVGRRLHLEGAIPLIEGNGTIRIGNDVRIGMRNSWTVGFKNIPDAEFVIGDRVNIGYQNVISAAKSIRIGDDTMFAPNVQIYDNPTHPMSPAARLRHEPFDPATAAPVVIGKNVWVGSGAFILKGVTIGDGAIVAALSIVTKDVPPNTLVAGNPAKVIRILEE